MRWKFINQKRINGSVSSGCFMNFNPNWIFKQLNINHQWRGTINVLWDYDACVSALLRTWLCIGSNRGLTFKYAAAFLIFIKLLNEISAYANIELFIISSNFLCQQPVYLMNELFHRKRCLFNVSVPIRQLNYITMRNRI